MSEFTQIKIAKSKNGATLQQFTIKQLSNFEIPVPHLDIQYEIVVLIGEEQKMVDINKELIKLFEQKIKDKISNLWGDKSK